MTIYYTCITRNGYLYADSSSRNLGNVNSVTLGLLNSFNNSTTTYNVINNAISASSTDSNESKMDNKATSINISNTIVNDNSSDHSRSTIITAKNDQYIKRSIIYDSHYHYHTITDTNMITYTALCTNDNNRLVYYSYLIDLSLRFYGTYGSRIRSLSSPSSLVKLSSPLSTPSTTDFSIIIDKQLKIFNGPSSVTLANIISNNRKLDLTDVSVETNNTCDLKINLNAASAAIITNISSTSASSASSAASTLSLFNKRNILTIIIVVIFIIIFITFGVVISFCGFQFEQC